MNEKKKGKQKCKNKIDWNGWYRDAPLPVPNKRWILNTKEKIFMISKPTNEMNENLIKNNQSSNNIRIILFFPCIHINFTLNVSKERPRSVFLEIIRWEVISVSYRDEVFISNFFFFSKEILSVSEWWMVVYQAGELRIEDDV